MKEYKTEQSIKYVTFNIKNIPCTVKYKNVNTDILDRIIDEIRSEIGD